MPIRRSPFSVGLALCTLIALHAPSPLAAGDPFPAVTRDTPHCLAAIPFEMVGNLVFFQVRVNGSRPLSFLLDSGANACVIDVGRARELHIPFGKKVQGKGAGLGTYDVWLIDKDKARFELPRLNLFADLVATFDLSSNLPVLGHAVDGIIGYDLMHQYVTEVDYDAQVVRLFDPRSYVHTGAGDSLHLTFENRVPHVVGHIEVPGQPAADRTLLVDTGSQDAVDDSLIARSAEVRQVLSGVGNGKEFHGVDGRVAHFKIGGFALNDFVGGGSGVPLIGGEIWRRFTIVFDYPHERMFIDPNRHLREPVSEDRSGLVLRWNAEKGVFVVHDLSPGSPAAEAGLEREDTVTAIDGCPAREYRLDRVERLLNEDGKSLTLTVRRHGRDADVKLTMRRLY
ncbi:MAG: aspartyl protease family protein [Candidatus Eisenbacteria bacterium]|nr:aspartyl protease family protein [Candidatus Eisenbacteria bacterium]